MNNITPISPLNIGNIQSSGSASGPKSPTSPIEQTTKTFGELLDSLNQSQQNSDNLLQKLSLGENVDLHQVIIGVAENDVNFRVAMSIRDKLVEAYRETMRMQV